MNNVIAHIDVDLSIFLICQIKFFDCHHDLLLGQVKCKSSIDNCTKTMCRGQNMSSVEKGTGAIVVLKPGARFDGLQGHLPRDLQEMKKNETGLAVSAK